MLKKISHPLLSSHGYLLGLCYRCGSLKLNTMNLDQALFTESASKCAVVVCCGLKFTFLMVAIDGL